MNVFSNSDLNPGENEIQDGDFPNFEIADEELPNSQEAIEAFILDQRAENTVRKTKSDLKIFQKYLDSIGKGNTSIETLPEAELDHLLSKFFMSVRKPDGTEYEPNSLSSYQRSIQRHLQDRKYGGNILKDEAFQTSRRVLAARRKSLVAKGKGNRPQATRALTDEEEDQLFASGQFGDNDPEVLQRTMWWLLSLHFGFRARDESRKLRWGDVDLQTANDGQEMLVWLGERGTKTRTGEENGHQRAYQSKAYSTNTERCPVRFYKEFRRHRPLEMNRAESPFFLAVKHKRSPTDEIWYMKAPLGKNQIGKFLSTAAKKAHIPQKVGAKVTNHSVRKTSISRLLDDNIPENFVAQHSGHKSTESLSAYKSAGQKQQKQMSMVLSRIPTRDIQPNSAVAASITNLEMNPLAVGFSQTTTTSNSSASNSSSFFSGVHTVQGCNFQFFNGEVNFHIPGKRRRIIESDDED